MASAATASTSADAAAAVDISAETPPAPSAATRAAASTHEPPAALSRADALVAVAEAYLSPAADEDATRHASAAPIELVLHVYRDALRTDARAHADGDAQLHPREHDPTHHLGTLADGTAIPLATAQRLACDAAVVTVTEDGRGNLLTLTRRTRRICATLRRALRVRDDGCRFPGCTNRLTDAHHVVAWARGGATSLANLCSLCRRHHRLVHEHGYRIETTPDGELRFLRRDGAVVATTARVRAAEIGPRHGSADGLALLRDAHRSRGLDIDARTAFPRWDGEPVDYDLVVQALLDPSAREATTIGGPPA